MPADLPSDLANQVFKRISRRTLKTPSLTTLVELFTTMYFSSLKTATSGSATRRSHAPLV